METQEKPKKLALIVGINSYADPTIQPLQGAVNDARAMQNLLITDYEFPDENVQVLVNEMATREAILKGLQKLVALADEKTIVVVHFSCHGSQQMDTNRDEGTNDTMDETFVPYDSGRSGSFENRDILDDEMGLVYDALRKKTEFITFIFDSCHSGDATRDLDVPRELAPDKRPLSGPALPSQPSVRGDSERDFAQISGCRENERSYEYLSDDGPCGTLTYFFVKEVRQSRKSGEKITYQDVMDRVTQRVSNVKPLQHPVVEGTGLDRELFGISRATAKPYFLVDSVEGNVVRFAAGRVHGLTPGSTLAIYPPFEKEFSDDAKIVATIQLKEVNAFDSKGVLEPPLNTPLKLASRATIRKRKHETAALRLAIEDGGPSTQDDFDALRRKLGGADYPIEFQLVSVTELPLLSVRLVSGNGQEEDVPRYAIFKGGAEMSSIPLSEDNKAARLAESLQRWANWENVLRLHNPESARLATLAISSSVVPNGGAVTFTVQNSSDSNLFFTLLDLSNDGGITPIVIRRPNEPLAKNETWTVKTKAKIPLGDKRKKVLDNVLLIATTVPVDFSFLKQEGVKGARDLPGDRSYSPLEQLIARKRYGSKNLESVDVETSNWSTDLVLLEVTP